MRISWAIGNKLLNTVDKSIFLETMWLSTALSRKNLIVSNITLKDVSFMKGFPPYPADVTIARLTMENLTFLLVIELKQTMAQHLTWSFFWVMATPRLTIFSMGKSYTV